MIDNASPFRNTHIYPAGKAFDNVHTTDKNYCITEKQMINVKNDHSQVLTSCLNMVWMNVKHNPRTVI